MKLETGAEIMVPAFIEQGQFVKVDTRNANTLNGSKNDSRHSLEIDKTSIWLPMATARDFGKAKRGTIQSLLPLGAHGVHLRLYRSVQLRWPQ